ncbi:MAG: hypothetical protein GF387_01840 [Candidatus Portnoybacteria bacterium]|nr:hypothetical protein [Candidatus Portnoybacteria bacterium]
MKYKQIDHPADIKVRVFGKTKKEIFLNALKALNDILEPEIEEKQTQEEIELESTSIENLLIEFLNEALYFTETKKEIYQDIDFKEFNDEKIKATLYGQAAKEFKQEIKAATYHELEFKKQDDQYQTTILFDI